MSRERIIEQLGPVGMGQESSEAHLPLMGNFKSASGSILSSPFVFEGGDCSNTNQDKPSPVLLGPFVGDGIKTSSPTDRSLEKSGSSPTMQPMCSMVLPPPPRQIEMVSVTPIVMETAISVPKISGNGGYCVQMSPSWPTQSQN